MTSPHYFQKFLVEKQKLYLKCKCLFIFQGKNCTFSRAKLQGMSTSSHLKLLFQVSYKDNWNEILIFFHKEFENNTLFLSLLNNHNAFDGKSTIFKISDTIQHNINFKKTLEKIKSYFIHTTHFYNLLEEICYDILEWAVRRFCTLTKEGCVTNTEKEVIKQLRDGNCKYIINKPGLQERIRKKWNVYVPQKFQSILVCA